jgi:hypothetical protein
MSYNQKEQEKFENAFKRLLQAWYSDQVFYYKSPLIKDTEGNEVEIQPRRREEITDEEIVF